MVSPYASGLTPMPLLAAGVVCCNNTTLINNSLACIHLASHDPTLMHCIGILPLCAGGFMLTNNAVRAGRLWLMELYDWARRRRR